MTSENRRLLALLAVAGVAGALVAIDRLGALEGASEGSSKMGAYTAQAELTGAAQQMVDSAAEWESLVESLEERWRSAREAMIEAPSAEVATARLRDAADRAMRDLGLSLDAWSPLSIRAPIEGESIRVIGLSLDLEAPNPDLVYQLLDRLEHLSEARVQIRRVSIGGPGPRPGAGVRIGMELEALAWIGGDA